MELDYEALLQNYLLETEENLNELENALLSLEQSPTNRDILELVFRKAHSIKSDASCLSFEPISELAHVAEDLLDLAREGTLLISERVVTTLLKGVDALRDLVMSAAVGEVVLSSDHRRLMQDIRELRGQQPASTRVSPAKTHPEEQTLAESSIPRNRERVSSLRVTTDRLDRMLDLAGEIAIARGRVTQMLERGGTTDCQTILEAHRVTDGLALELQEQIMRVRMVPIGPTFRQYARSVRELGRTQGKVARLHIEGADAEVDTSVIEHLREPLAHILRNAIDHGIEPPAERKAAGKDPCGQVALRASHRAGSFVVEIADDGRGVSGQRIAARAVERGLVSDAEKFSEAELHNMVFHNGLSTAESVTEISGRGVGLDIVRRSIEALRGTVEIESVEGVGATIRIRLPLTLAIIAGFSVGVGEETYVIPLDAVEECLHVPVQETQSNLRAGILNVRGEPLPYLRLRNLFGLNGQNGERESVVVVSDNGRRAGIAVDALYGENQTVIKPLGQIFENVPGVSGSAILGNGRVALILDPPNLLREVLRENPMQGAEGIGA